MLTITEMHPYYNGGVNWWEDYANYPANKKYVGEAANKLNDVVPKTFGESDPTPVNILKSVQHVEDCQMNP